MKSSNYLDPLLVEANRVLELARSTHPPGRLITATYKFGTGSQGPFYDLHVLNPADLQPTISVNFVRYYLYSVRDYDQWQDQRARLEAEKRREATLVEVEREIAFREDLGVNV